MSEIGKVFQKLMQLPQVKRITFDVNKNATIELADGYANDGAVEITVKTAHAARLWIQAASDGKPSTKRAARAAIRENNNITIVDGVEVVIERYPGLDMPKTPIWEMPKGWNRNEAEGRDAFLRGFDKKSHAYGESLGGREFEAAWEYAKKNHAIVEQLRKDREAKELAESVPMPLMAA